MDLSTLLRCTTRSFPDHELLRYQGQCLRYPEFLRLSRQAARVLAQHGVGAGDRVALICRNTPGFLLAAYGAWQLGAVVVPVNHKLQAPEVDYILQHARVRLCIVDGTLAPLVAQLHTPVTALWTDTPAEGLASFDALIEAAPPLPDGPPPGADSPAQLLYTSGTTGKPKGCLHSHRNVVMQALACCTSLSIGHDTRMLVAMPIWHASPLNNWTLATLAAGGTVVLLREYQPRAFLEIIEAERTTMTFAAPVALLAPLHSVPDFQRFDLSSMKLWIYGGGPLGREMAEKLIAAYGSERFVQVYGMTETGPLGTALYPQDALRKAGSIGRASTVTVQLRVVDPQDRPLDGPGVGEIQLRSEAMMQGYLDDPEATARAFTDDGWYRSGDLARVDEEGFMFIVDRAKDMIITGGENVYSKEVEDALAPHPAVQDAAVIGRPHPEWGETVIAFVVLRPGQSADAQALAGHLAPRLARYKIPREFHFCEALPRTPTGKIMKHQLRQQLAGGA